MLYALGHLHSVQNLAEEKMQEARTPRPTMSSVFDGAREQIALTDSPLPPAPPKQQASECKVPASSSNRKPKPQTEESEKAIMSFLRASAPDGLQFHSAKDDEPFLENADESFEFEELKRSLDAHLREDDKRANSRHSMPPSTPLCEKKPEAEADQSQLLELLEQSQVCIKRLRDEKDRVKQESRVREEKMKAKLAKFMTVLDRQEGKIEQLTSSSGTERPRDAPQTSVATASTLTQPIDEHAVESLIRAKEEAMMQKVKEVLSRQQAKAAAQIAELEAKLAAAANDVDAAALAKAKADASAAGQTAAAKDAEAAQLKTQLDLVMSRLREESAERRRLHDLVQTLRGNIRVIARIRPRQEGGLPCVNADATLGAEAVATRAIVRDPVNGNERMFRLDAVLDIDASQQAVFAEVEPLVRSALDGHNVCIVAYGATGAGKTHTMLGTRGEPGLCTRAAQALFAVHQTPSPSIAITAVEIYLERAYDLLAAERPELGAGATPTRRDVPDAAALAAAVHEVATSRATASTRLNDRSSRSHCIITLHIAARDDLIGTDAASQLHLVDLAGSECVGKSGATGQQLREAQAINRSLLAFGESISALQRRQNHVPFRDSKLTMLLKDSLTNGSKCLLIAAIDSAEPSSTETARTLEFAAKASQVELKGDRRASGGRASVGSGRPSLAKPQRTAMGKRIRPGPPVS